LKATRRNGQRLAEAFGQMRSLKITQPDELQWSLPRAITKRASKNARIDYRPGVLIASLAFNLGWTLDKRVAEVQCCLYR
jgi:hypothetical protein